MAAWIRLLSLIVFTSTTFAALKESAGFEEKCARIIESSFKDQEEVEFEALIHRAFLDWKLHDWLEMNKCMEKADMIMKDLVVRYKESGEIGK